MTRVLSAVALAVLGIAGWMLQSRSEDARRTLESRDRSERRYLPTLRSLSELELVLSECASALPKVWGEESSPDPRIELYQRQLSYVAHSVFLPEGDLSVRVHPPNYDNELDFRSVPIRSGSLMLAELLRAQWAVVGIPLESNVRLDSNQRVLRFVDGSEYLVSAAALPAWQKWIGNDQIRVRDLVGPRNVFIADDLRQGAAEQIHAIVMKHPDLGDRYVAIRSEVLRQQADILAPLRPSKQ